MREIKFRIITPEDGVIGFFKPGLKDIAIPDNGHWQQYTGLKDKNGVEIYEGDICKYYDSEPDDKVEFETSRDGYDGRWHDVELIGAIEWENESAGFTVGGTKWFEPRVEVIGNIYENPELLK